MRRFFIALLFMLLTGSLAFPTEDEDYTFQASSGYYLRGNDKYVRSKESWYEWVPSYGYGYNYGSYRPYYRYVYTKVAVPVIDPQAPDAIDKLLEIAKVQRAGELKLQQAAQKNNAFLEVVDKLGMAGSFKFKGYDTPPALANPYRQYGNAYTPYLGPHGVQGTSLYGQAANQQVNTYSQTVDVYGTIDLMALFQQQTALVQGAQQLAGQGFQGSNELLGRVVDGRNRDVLEREATRRAIAIIRETRPEPRIRIETQGTTQGSTIGPVPIVPNAINPRVELSNREARFRGASQSCLPCHSGQTINGKYSVLLHPQLSNEQKKKIVRDRLLTSDPGILMPRDDKGVGHSLPLESILPFLE